jgi:hypothetical protein
VIRSRAGESAIPLPRPQPLPYDVDAARALPWADRLRLACQAWAIQGYGPPWLVYALYLLKIGGYVGLWWAFCSLSADWNAAESWSDQILSATAFQKAVFWSMAFEVLGFGCGSGPLTARYLPPFGACLHFARPGTIRLPLFPRLLGCAGDRRSWFDALLYLALVASLFRVLVAPVVTGELVWPIVGLLPILALRDKTIFLAARGEHYYALSVCFLFGEQWVAGAIAVQSSLWLWAAVSKLTPNFPAVVCAMVSNGPIMRWRWLREKLYRQYPEDLRPARSTVVLAHAGTLLEFGFPLLLLFGGGGELTSLGLVLMVVFHVYITSNFPAAVPIEWNVMMVYSACVLFVGYGDVVLWSLSSPVLTGFLTVMLIVVPLIGNLVPSRVSFLLSMRYYAGNWPYSIWLFRGDSVNALHEHVVTCSAHPREQMRALYDETIVEGSMQLLAAFRAMHLHGRALHTLLPRAVDDLSDYDYHDGELVAGYVLGWNFGDGHLHQAQLLQAIQTRCGFEEGELRCVFVESQPLFGRSLQYSLHDAASGQFAAGEIRVDDLLKEQPWPTD